MTMTEKPKKAPINEATKTLFRIAARSHVLAEQFGIRLEDDESIIIMQINRPWLMLRHDGTLSFDPDEYSKTIDDHCSTYTREMRLWILNVWNPSYARSKGWTFDIFKACRGLDTNNLAAIAWWLQSPVWP